LNKDLANYLNIQLNRSGEIIFKNNNSNNNNNISNINNNFIPLDNSNNFDNTVQTLFYTDKNNNNNNNFENVEEKNKNKIFSEKTRDDEKKYIKYRGNLNFKKTLINEEDENNVYLKPQRTKSICRRIIEYFFSY
jgi:hypothetical protein